MLTLRELSRIYQSHSSVANLPVADFSLGSLHFDHAEQRYLMGVLNLSADSWYRESVCLTEEAAIRRGRVLQEQGSHIIDVGAESTLAHAALVSETAQQNLLMPVVRGLAEAGIIVSIESYHHSVTKACFEAGARVLNLTGTENIEPLLDVVAAHEGAVILCFVQGPDVRTVVDRELAEDPIPLLEEYFSAKIAMAKKHGITRIWIDPGLGFYYRNLQDSTLRIRHQMQVFLNTFRLKTLGWPICHALPHAFTFFEEEVRTAEPFFAVLAQLGEVNLIRTHEIPKVRSVIKTMESYS